MRGRAARGVEREAQMPDSGRWDPSASDVSNFSLGGEGGRLTPHTRCELGLDLAVPAGVEDVGIVVCAGILVFLPER